MNNVIACMYGQADNFVDFKRHERELRDTSSFLHFHASISEQYYSRDPRVHDDSASSNIVEAIMIISDNNNN